MLSLLSALQPSIRTMKIKCRIISSQTRAIIVRMRRKSSVLTSFVFSSNIIFVFDRLFLRSSNFSLSNLIGLMMENSSVITNQMNPLVYCYCSLQFAIENSKRKKTKLTFLEYFQYFLFQLAWRFTKNHLQVHRDMISFSYYLFSFLSSERNFLKQRNFNVWKSNEIHLDRGQKKSNECTDDVTCSNDRNSSSWLATQYVHNFKTSWLFIVLISAECIKTNAQTV